MGIDRRNGGGWRRGPDRESRLISISLDLAAKLVATAAAVAAVRMKFITSLPEPPLVDFEYKIVELWAGFGSLHHYFIDNFVELVFN